MIHVLFLLAFLGALVLFLNELIPPSVDPYDERGD